MKLLLPLKGALALYLVCTLMLAAVSTAPVLLIKLWLDHLQGKGHVATDRWGLWIEEHIHSQFSNDTNYLYMICGAAIVMLVVKAVLDVLTTYQQGWISQRLVVDANVRLLKHMLTLDMAFYDKRKIGDLLTRLGGDTEALRATAKMTLDMLQQPPLILMLLVTAILLNWQLLCIGMVGMIFVIWPVIYITRRIYKHAKRARQQQGELFQGAVQCLQGIRTVQAYSAENAEGENYKNLAGNIFKTIMRKIRNRALQRPLAEVVMGIAGVTVLVVGSLQVLSGEMPLENLVSFLAALGMLYQPVRGVLSTFGEIAEFLPAAERSFEILDIKPDIHTTPGASACPRLAKELSFEDVTFDYGRGPVFEGLNLRVRMGERLGIVGKTGVGKSTLLSLVLRFYDPVKGRVCIDGTDIKGVTIETLRAQIAFVTQDPFLFHTTIENNIGYGRPGAGIDEIHAAAKAAGVHDEIAALPEGYKTLVSDRGLSGGQKQRVCVARAILRNAPILLLDEATSSLDSAVEAKVQEALEKLSAGRTCLIVAHRLSTVKTCDRIVVFSPKGGIEAIGPHDELLATCPTYKHLWDVQTGGGGEAPSAAAS